MKTAKVIYVTLAYPNLVIPILIRERKLAEACQNHSKISCVAQELPPFNLALYLSDMMFEFESRVKTRQHTLQKKLVVSCKYIRIL